MYQTRNYDGELRDFETLEEALLHARSDLDVWKISFPLAEGTRMRLIREHTVWVYENIDGSRE